MPLDDGSRRRISSASSISVSVGRREGGTAPDLRLDGGDDLGMGVPQDQRRVVAQEVAVGVAVDVGHAQSLRRDAMYGGYGGVKTVVRVEPPGSEPVARSNSSRERGVRAR